MPYATPDKVRNSLARIYIEQGGTGGALDDPVLVDFCAEADAEVDGRLRARYTVPLDPAPLLIQRIAVSIACYLADLTFREVRDYQSQLNPVLLRYQRAQDLLGKLVSGELDLPSTVPGPEDPAQSGGVVVQVYEYDNPFTCGTGSLQAAPCGCGSLYCGTCWWGSPECWGVRW